ncbi:MAG: hypothetical protein ABJE10_18830 [bacterium]
MTPKSQQLQIRVTPAQKSAMRRLAREADLDVSAYVLSRVLPADEERFAAILRVLHVSGDERFALAELNDFLTALAPARFATAVGRAKLDRLSLLLQNYVAAMVEQAAGQKEVAPPVWTRDVAPLAEPYFATSLSSLRLYLLQASPVPFKRRNLFVDAAVGSRV